MLLKSNKVLPLLLLLWCGADSFAPCGVLGRNPSSSDKNLNKNLARSSSSSKLHLFDLFNQGKKALVQKLAGEYDASAIQERMTGLIDANPGA